MNLDTWELLSYIVTVVGLPLAIFVYLFDQRKERNNEDMTPDQTRRWRSWEDYMREWCRRPDFLARLPLLLGGEDPAFAQYIQALVTSETTQQARENA